MNWVRLAEQYRLPAIYALSFFPAEGGLMSYATDSIELVHGAASYIDRILRGAKVSDLPVQYPTLDSASLIPFEGQPEGDRPRDPAIAAAARR